MVIENFGQFIFVCLAFYGATTIGYKFQTWVNS
jgi:hypothetical protein